jgi:hypothetical protein
MRRARHRDRQVPPERSSWPACSARPLRGLAPRAVLGSLVGGLLAFSCAPPPPPPAAVPPPAPPPPAASAAPPLAAPPPDRRLTDPLWTQAASGDPLEKARLAVAVGAAELLAAVEAGGPPAETALEALPFADDGDLALGRLAEIAKADPARRHAVLAAILGVAGRPRQPRELLDPEGVRRAGEAVLSLAADRALPREDRALAVSAARALAEKGFVDARRIPSDLDPK